MGSWAPLVSAGAGKRRRACAGGEILRRCAPQDDGEGEAKRPLSQRGALTAPLSGEPKKDGPFAAPAVGTGKALRARGRLCVRPYPPVCALGTSPEGGSKERGRPGRGDGLAPGARSFVAALLRMTEGRTGKGMKKKDRRRPPVVTGHDDRAEERAEARATDGELSAQPAMGGAFSPGERRKKGNSNRAAAGRSSAFAPGGGTERGSEAGAPDGVSGNWS